MGEVEQSNTLTPEDTGLNGQRALVWDSNGVSIVPSTSSPTMMHAPRLRQPQAYHDPMRVELKQVESTKGK
jgi:hypothetical protein